MPRTILIIDDISTNREVLKKILGDQYTYLEASNGQEAMEVIGRNYKLLSAVLLDLIMPVMDGFEVLRRMRSNAALMQIPVIVMTGSADAKSEETALTTGASDYITKPYNATIVRLRIHNTISLRENAATINSLQKDRLTKLFNREAFFERVAQMIRMQRPGYYILSCFDIENFKVINDQYGSEAGDAVLKHVADCIEHFASTVNGLCCRVMADNFAILYPASSITSDELDKSHKAIVKPPAINKSINIRIGRYLVDDLTLSPSAMYDRACLAERSIKGRYDTYVAQYEESMRSEILREQEIVNEMNAALRDRQFEVWYQPQYNHSSGALIGAEALVRWRHPAKGLIPPGVFIPIFERNGFVYELDKFVWEETCRCLRRWIDEGRHPLAVSVNVSRYDIFRGDLVDTILDITSRYAIPAELLRLEITESAFAQSTQQIVSVVKEFISHGFTIEIDDFGSGYSSLNTLKSVPAQVIKLDMRFLEGDGDSQRGGNIIESIVRMAKWLGMSVLAEGVEDIRQANFLKSIGCSYVQGYLYAKPMPIQDYEALCKGHGKEERMLALETVENLDNNTFWDPKSMDTLIFNSYVGGACIFEYLNDKLELLRVNDKYILEFAGGLTSEQLYADDLLEYMDDENREILLANIRNAIRSGGESTCVTRIRGLYGLNKDAFIRSTVRSIARAGERYLMYCSVINMTAQIEAEQNERRASEQSQAIMDDAGSGITAAVIKDGKPSFLFSNDKYYDILGFTRAQYDAEVPDLYELIYPQDREDVRQLAMQAYAERTSARVQYRVICRDGAIRWVRAILSCTHFTGIDQPVQLCVISDITAEKQAEQELRETDEQLRFLNDTAHELLAQPDSNLGINAVLNSLIAHFGASRAYVFEIKAKEDVAVNTYEVCAPGVVPRKDNLQAVPLAMLEHWKQAFRQHDYIDIDDVDALDDSHADEKAILLEQGVRSLIAVPLKRGGELIGMIGVDDPSQQHSRIDRLVALGDYIAMMLTRRDLDARLTSGSVVLQSLMNDTPGGFARLHIQPDGSIMPVYVNEGLLKLLNMTHDELMAMYETDAYAGVHPDDTAIVDEAVSQMLAKGQAHSSKYRLRSGNGDYLWVMIFGRATKNSTGETFLNIYYTDVTEQNKAEQQQRELLDNLPCGAALYEYDGNDLTVLHLNKRYWELVGRKPVDSNRLSVMNAIYPDDRATILQAIAAAIRDGTDVACDVRVLYGQGEYHFYHIIGRIVPRDDDSHILYATFTPISDEALSYQELLPMVLNAIMESSSDLAFAKDRELRYICASGAFARMVGLSNARDVVGKTDYDLFPKEIADKYRHDDETLMKNGKSMIDMVEAIPSDDHVPHFSSTSKYLLRNTRGKLIGLYGAGRDITASRDAFSKLKLLTDSIQGGLATYLCAKDGIRITYFNDTFVKLLGYAREEFADIAENDALMMVYPDDLPIIRQQLKELLESDAPMVCTFRIHTRSGERKWVSLRGTLSERRNDAVVVNAVFFDITDQVEITERLRLSEEEYRIALNHSGSLLYRYNLSDSSVSVPPSVAALFSIPEHMDDVPNQPIKQGLISPETAQDFLAMFASIRNGDKEGVATFCQNTAAGWRWIEARYSTLFSSDGKPLSAVISMHDVTEQREKETVYKKWQQSLDDKPLESYTLFRCNLSKNASFDVQEGSLLNVSFSAGAADFDSRTADYVKQCVYDDDKEAYKAILNSNTLLAGYYRGKRSSTLEYREKLPGGGTRWLKLSVDLVEYPNATDVEAYLMYENIDEAKRSELQTKQLAQTDPLTGVLNRVAFAQKANEFLTARKPDELYALLMFDLDGFKLVNDSFGHSVGDQALIDIANQLRSILRHEDLIGRLGGDEFFVFLRDMPSLAVIGQKAKLICDTVRKAFSVEVQLSASLGIAVCPENGADFEALYHKADIALYHIKATSKDNYAFYRDDMSGETPRVPNGIGMQPAEPAQDDRLKRRMLIVEDSQINQNLLTRIFRDDFIIDTADDGGAALIRLRRYGTGISVVLLDLMMPGMDGFAVLEKMRQSPEMQTIPVIVVSGMNEREASLRAIKCGACDFITKPVDPALLRVRVQSAISKAENERLRAQNSFLALQSGEVSKCRAVLDALGVVTVEYDRESGRFAYDHEISQHITGRFDERPLWQILLEDAAAEPAETEGLKRLISQAAANAAPTDDGMQLTLKTPDGSMRRFDVRVVAQPGADRTDGRLTLALTDADVFRQA